MFLTKHHKAPSSQASQENLIRELNHSVEVLKQKLVEKLELVKVSATRQILESSQRTSKKVSPSLSFDAQIVKNFEKTLTKELEKLRSGIINGGSYFEPAIVNSLEVPANIGFNYGANVYNQKHNLIISCPSNSHVHFYDGDDLTQIKSRKKRELSSSVVQMTYCPETDTHLMGCAFGDIYAYNAQADTLTKIMKEGDSFVLAITYISPTTFAFSSSKSGKLYFGTTNGAKALPHYSKDSDAWYLHHINQQKLLLSGLSNGKIAIYNTNTRNGARYPMLDSLQAHKFGKYVTVINSVTISGKQYIITGGNDHTIKIWHLTKGKMRLLKVIPTTEDVSTFVYLEDYKMLASTHHKDFIKFFKMPFGKLETTLTVGLTKARNIFSMPDKRSLGVADLNTNVIKIVQIQSSGNSKSM